MPTPLTKHAITKTGKVGAEDWIVYAITCKSEPRTIACIMIIASESYADDAPFLSALLTFPKPNISVRYMLATPPTMPP